MCQKPIFVFAPGAGFQAAHYGYVMHLLMKGGCGAVSGHLPSEGVLNAEKVTVEDGTKYVRERLIQSILDNEERDVIAVGHSYSGMPVSAAVSGLVKPDRAAAGKKTSVLGHVHISSLILKGGDGSTLLGAFGGNYPPHVITDEASNLIRCADPVPPMMQDVEPALARAAALSTICPSLTSFNSPCPRATWDEPGYKARIAFIKTTQDFAVPLQIQEMLIAASGQEWIIREDDSGHAPTLPQPEKCSELLVEFAKQFEAL